ncbi:hypothetical protein PAHAL_2G109900 [Panicum hallii]|uniref:Uncharacterized protein n=1 Tax=Panicum hallii TaxID=206008 RepID=A0A2T8KNV1_9POAL|nr:uncharacterized protein LOC112879342 isoform X2 [Panicum hallii]PVH63802.1 hypothetical protein PAHAL_2G109900 [Panicum hallii]
MIVAQQVEKDLNGSATESIAADKKLGIFDKIFSAYHDARSCICNDLASAGNAENIRDDLNGLDKAVSAVLGLRTIECNQLLASIAKSKFTKQRDEKNETNTKPEKNLFSYMICLFRCFFLVKSYSSAGKRAEAFALFCHAQTLNDFGLQQLANSPDKVLTLNRQHELQIAMFLVRSARVLRVMKFLCENDCNPSWLTNQKRRLLLDNRASLGAQFVFQKFTKSCIRFLKQATCTCLL